MSITTDTAAIFRRAANAVTVMQSLDRHFNIEEAEALEGSTAPRDGHKAPTVPTDEPEPPTGHKDPTGGAATSGRLQHIHRNRATISRALGSVDKAFNHLDLAARSVLSTTRPTDDIAASQLCAGPDCELIREPGRELCLGCGQALAILERETAHPICGSLGCDRPVERYKLASGLTGYRLMYYDGETWRPNSEAVPTCSTCRRSDKVAS
jgi:hypothetical protein